MTKRKPVAPDATRASAPSVAPRLWGKAGKYHRLYEYLENRYASTVVLTLDQIEDLLGFALPESARSDQGWWALSGSTDAGCADAWTLASRTAKPNLQARTVAFERAE